MSVASSISRSASERWVVMVSGARDGRTVAPVVVVEVLRYSRTPRSVSYGDTLFSLDIGSTVGFFATGGLGASGRKIGPKIEVPKRRVFRWRPVLSFRRP